MTPILLSLAGDHTQLIVTSRLSLKTMSACIENMFNRHKSTLCHPFISEQAEGRMRFPESLIQLKASGALKGAFSLPCFFISFPLRDC